MKFLKKASLAASIAAVSFAANAELVAMDEMAMAATTGQAGVDIDITLQGTEAISIGGILYRDTDTDGGVLVDGVTLGAADGGEVVLTNAIDINADGSIQIVGNTEAQSLVLGIGSVDTVTSAYTTGAADGVNIMGASTIYMNVIGGTTTIRDQADDADTEFNEAGTVISMSGGSVEVTSVDGQSTDVSLLNNAISLGGLKVYGNGGEGTGISTNADILFNDSGVTITNVDLAGTIEIQQLGLGANTGTAENPNNVIGSLAISDIALNGAKITISGR
jgi:hypothetical protein